MNTKTTRRPRLGAVAGILALAVATSGGAYAAGVKITSSAQIKTGVVTSSDIKNGTLKVKDLSPKTVTKINQLEAWKTADLAPSWIPFPNYTAPSFRVDAANGVVHLRGATSFGSDNGSNKTVFQLPAGYRPANTVTLPVATFDGLGTQSPLGAIDIEADGDVRIYGSGDDRFVSFEGVSFALS